MPLFDDYLIVDWSANASPKTGADSIWYCLAGRDRRDRLRISTCRNPATRRQAHGELRALLKKRLHLGRRILIGYDFPNGYPAGFAQAAGFASSAQKSWRATWQRLSDLIEDGENNDNNRFDVANNLNKRLPGMPFWGHPQQRNYSHLAPTKLTYDNQAFAERRLCEQWVPKAQTVWKLYTTGSVGSQTLMGIPYQAALLHDPDLRDHIQVWPFQTGLKAPIDPTIVLAEVYPSLFPFPNDPNRVKDALQVETTAKALAKRDRGGLLVRDFAGPETLNVVERKRVVDEEGWILGVGTISN
jgi:precorrin-8X/cobalt-precorrin-8 methylmutase